MIFIVINTTNDKHDCFIINSDGEVLYYGFLLLKLSTDSINYSLKFNLCVHFWVKKVGLDATEHYIYSTLGFLLNKGLTAYMS